MLVICDMMQMIFVVIAMVVCPDPVASALDHLWINPRAL